MRGFGLQKEKFQCKPGTRFVDRDRGSGVACRMRLESVSLEEIQPVCTMGLGKFEEFIHRAQAKFLALVNNGKMSSYR